MKIIAPLFLDTHSPCSNSHFLLRILANFMVSPSANLSQYSSEPSLSSSSSSSSSSLHSSAFSLHYSFFDCCPLWCFRFPTDTALWAANASYSSNTTASAPLIICRSLSTDSDLDPLATSSPTRSCSRGTGRCRIFSHPGAEGRWAFTTSSMSLTNRYDSSELCFSPAHPVPLCCAGSPPPAPGLNHLCAGLR